MHPPVMHVFPPLCLEIQLSIISNRAFTCDLPPRHALCPPRIRQIAESQMLDWYTCTCNPGQILIWVTECESSITLLHFLWRCGLAVWRLSCLFGFDSHHLVPSSRFQTDPRQIRHQVSRHFSENMHPSLTSNLYRCRQMKRVALAPTAYLANGLAQQSSNALSYVSLAPPHHILTFGQVASRK